MIDIDKLDFEKNGGTVTIIAQDAESGRVLMVAAADRQAIERTVETREMHYRSRTRGLWRKGETSGNTQQVTALTADCDGDVVLASVISKGPACHNGTRSCFGDNARSDIFSELNQIIVERSASEASEAEKPSYTRTLLDDRNLRLKKLGEEAAELVTACADADRGAAITEAADLLYHVLVALHPLGASIDDVRHELARRAGYPS